MFLQKLRNPSWRNVGLSGEHPDFYAEPEPEPEPNHETERAELIDDYLDWFSDETDTGRERLRTLIETLI